MVKAQQLNLHPADFNQLVSSSDWRSRAEVARQWRFKKEVEKW